MKLLTILLALLLALPVTSMADCAEGSEAASQQASHDCCEGDDEDMPASDDCNTDGACANCGLATPTAISVSPLFLSVSTVFSVPTLPDPGLPPAHAFRLLRPPIC